MYQGGVQTWKRTNCTGKGKCQHILNPLEFIA